MVTADFGERDAADCAKAERARRGEESERSGERGKMRRNGRTLFEGWDFPALFTSDLFEPGFIFSPFLPPD
jgi:hypothetical protein